MGNLQTYVRTGHGPIALIAIAVLIPTPVTAKVYEVAHDGSVHVCGLDASGTTSCTGFASDSASSEEAPDVPTVAITTVGEPNVPSSLRTPLLAASVHYGVSPRLLAALTGQESAWRASIVSAKGAIGLTQLMPATARAMAVDPRDPAANLAGGARYLRQLLDRFDGDLERALAAYNAGPVRVDRAKGVPPIPETRAYVTGIVGRLSASLDEQRK